MFGVGWTEMLLIGVVALIVIGPKDLPVVMNRLGKAVSTIRRMGAEFQRELNKTTGLDQLTDLRKSITEPLKQTAAEIRGEFNKPLAGGGFAPSGAIKPKDPEIESVVEEIHANLGMVAPEPVTPPVKRKRARKVASPAPAEAIAPVKPARKPRAKAASKPADPGPVEEASGARKALADQEAAAVKAATPRKPRAKTVKTTPKAEV